MGIVLLLFSFGCIKWSERVWESTQLVREKNEKAELALITLYDNYEGIPGLKTDWGFSCLVKVGGKNILFDVGGNSEIMLSNTEKLGVKPEEIDSIVLSHVHRDHAGGLLGVLEKNSDLSVFLPESFPTEFKERIKSLGASVVEVSGSVKVSENALSTGELGAFIEEQSLIVKTGNGLVVITGCAHPRIIEIINRAKELTGENVFLVIGGFHLLDKSELALKQIVKKFRELGVERVAPSHCSGDKARELFEKEYKEYFVQNGVGRMIRI